MAYSTPPRDPAPRARVIPPLSAPPILIVDDVDDNRVLAGRMLERAGFATMACESGREALAIVARRRPCLVLLDWMMPEMTGMEVLVELRVRWSKEQLPVVMCTGLGERASVVAAYGAGATDFIQKPFTSHTLMARMKAALEPTPAKVA